MRDERYVVDKGSVPVRWHVQNGWLVSGDGTVRHVAEDVRVVIAVHWATAPITHMHTRSTATSEGLALED